MVDENVFRRYISPGQINIAVLNCLDVLSWNFNFFSLRGQLFSRASMNQCIFGCGRQEVKGLECVFRNGFCEQMWFLAESRFAVANAVTQYDKRTLDVCDLDFQHHPYRKQH